jgi:hypothetical protein
MSPEDRFLKDNPEWQSVADLIHYPPSAEEITESFADADPELLKRCDEWVQPNVTRGAIYYKMRSSGESEKMAAMLALQRSTGISTDDTFFSGSKPLYDQFESQKHLDRFLGYAKAQGFTPPVNSTYFPNLARFPGDKEAWVTRAMGRSYIRKLIEQRGGKMDASMNATWNEPESDPLEAKNCTPLGDDIVKRYSDRMVKKDPSLSRLSRRELREKVIETHGPTW